MGNQIAQIICIAPEFDEVTEITYEESRDIVKYAVEHDVDVVELVKDQATRSKVEEIIRTHLGAVIYHADHGNERSWIGSGGRPCVDTANVEILRGRVCYCNNCSSAKKLGVEAWKRGAIYWGYTDVFVFTTDAPDEFKEFINCGLKKRIDGLSWAKCLEFAKELANKLIDLLVKSGKALAASCLRWDRDHLVCYTSDNPPETDCQIRKILLRIFGLDLGWKINFP